MYDIIEEVIAILEGAIVEQDWDAVLESIRMLETIPQPDESNELDGFQEME